MSFQFFRLGDSNSPSKAIYDDLLFLWCDKGVHGKGQHFFCGPFCMGKGAWSKSQAFKGRLKMDRDRIMNGKGNAFLFEIGGHLCTGHTRMSCPALIQESVLPLFFG